MTYISHITEPKIPWSWRRTFALFKTYFTGIVPTIPPHVIEQRKVDWAELDTDEREAEIAWTKERSKLRRDSMAETATRSNSILAGIGIATAMSTAAIAVVIVTKNTAGALYLLLGFSCLILAIFILLLAISAKGKVLRRPRKGGESEADEHLAKTVAIKKAPGFSPDSMQYARYEKAAEQLDKRKIILTVERRAQLIGVLIAGMGLLFTGFGLWNTFFG